MMAADKKFTCPRRVEDGTHRDDSPLAYAGSNKDEWRDSNTCPYCGSLNPEEFMQRLELGEDELTPTDKSYKVYIGKTKKFYFQHLSKEQMIRFVELLNKEKLRLGYPGYFYTRPFFIAYGKE